MRGSMKSLYVLLGGPLLILLCVHVYKSPKWPPNRSSTIASRQGENNVYHKNCLDSMRKRVNYKEVMMDPVEVDVVLRAIRGRKSYLEWGSGGSTLNFPQFIAPSGKVVSIEHDKEWCERMSGRLRLKAKKKITHKVQLYCVKTIGQNGNEGKYATFKPYIDKINALQNVPAWDFVFIDGRARVAAAIRTLSYIRNDSAVVVHDFERVLQSGSDDYSGMLKYYDVVERTGNSVKMNSGTRGMAHLRRKEKYGRLEGKHDEVQKILDENKH